MKAPDPVTDCQVISGKPDRLSRDLLEVRIAYYSFVVKFAFSYADAEWRGLVPRGTVARLFLVAKEYAAENIVAPYAWSQAEADFIDRRLRLTWRKAARAAAPRVVPRVVVIRRALGQRIRPAARRDAARAPDGGDDEPPHSRAAA